MDRSTPPPSLPFTSDPLDSSWLDPAVAQLAAEGVIAYPTETVWGLGACADRARAIDRLFAWKGRAHHNPLAVLVASPAAAAALGCEFDARARRLAEQFWPGPLMLIVPCRGRFAPGVTREDGALGLRCSPHPVARALTLRLEQEGLGPLTSTSLNRSGEAPARRREDAICAIRVAPAVASTDLEQPLLVAPSGYDAGGGAPSSVVDCTKPVPEILREGAIEGAVLSRAWSA